MMRAVSSRVPRRPVGTRIESHFRTFSATPLSQTHESATRISTWAPPPFEKLSYKHPSMEHKEFVKEIRKPHGLYTRTMEAVHHELKGMSTLRGDAAARALLNEKEREDYLVKKNQCFNFRQI